MSFVLDEALLKLLNGENLTANEIAIIGKNEVLFREAAEIIGLDSSFGTVTMKKFKEAVRMYVRETQAQRTVEVRAAVEESAETDAQTEQMSFDNSEGVALSEDTAITENAVAENAAVNTEETVSPERTSAESKSEVYAEPRATVSEALGERNTAKSETVKPYVSAFANIRGDGRAVSNVAVNNAAPTSQKPVREAENKVSVDVSERETSENVSRPTATVEEGLKRGRKTEASAENRANMGENADIARESRANAGENHAEPTATVEEALNRSREEKASEKSEKETKAPEAEEPTAKSTSVTEKIRAFFRGEAANYAVADIDSDGRERVPGISASKGKTDGLFDGEKGTANRRAIDTMARGLGAEVVYEGKARSETNAAAKGEASGNGRDVKVFILAINETVRAENEGISDAQIKELVAKEARRVSFHELGHIMKMYAGEAYDRFIDYAVKLYKAKYSEERFNKSVNDLKAENRGMTDSEAREEIACDMIPDILEDEKKLESFVKYMERDRTRFGRFLNAVHELMGRVRTFFEGLGFKARTPDENLIRDAYIEMRRAYNRSAAEYRGQKRNGTVAGTVLVDRFGGIRRENGENGIKNAKFSFTGVKNGVRSNDEGVSPKTVDTAKITPGMSDEERAEVLNNSSIRLAEYVGDGEISPAKVYNLKTTYGKQARKILLTLGEKFGVFDRQYYNKAVELTFNYSKSSLKESFNKQSRINKTVENRTGFEDFAKMLSVFDDVVNNAVPIEVHEDKYKGTQRETRELKHDYVLLSAFKDGDFIIPVELHIKEFDNNDGNRLYVNVTLGKVKIEEGEISTTPPAVQNERQTRIIPSPSTISVPQLIGELNNNLGNFFKYLPPSMLSEAQNVSRSTAVDDENYRLSVMRGEDVSETLKKKAEENGYARDESWKMDHKAPNASDGYSNSMDNIDASYGSDGSIYSANAVYYYGEGRAYDSKAIAIIRSAKNNPDKIITVYRAVPKSIEDTRMRNGDWVAIVKEYAHEHGDRVLDGDYRIIENKAPAKYLYSNGDSINEWGFDNGNENEVYKNTKNNVKILEPTYSDSGELIPLSERFNDKNSDIRYSTVDTTKQGEDYDRNKDKTYEKRSEKLRKLLKDDADKNNRPQYEQGWNIETSSGKKTVYASGTEAYLFLFNENQALEAAVSEDQAPDRMKELVEKIDSSEKYSSFDSVKIDLAAVREAMHKNAAKDNTVRIGNTLFNGEFLKKICDILGKNSTLFLSPDNKASSVIESEYGKAMLFPLYPGENNEGLDKYTDIAGISIANGKDTNKTNTATKAQEQSPELKKLREKYEGKEIFDGKDTYRITYSEEYNAFVMPTVKSDGTLERGGATIVPSENPEEFLENFAKWAEKRKQDVEKRKERERIEAEKEALLKKKQAEKEKYLTSFLSGKSPMQAGKMRKTLIKYFTGGLNTHEFIEKAVRDGKEFKAEEENGKNSYWLLVGKHEGYIITKTAYDYGKFLEGSDEFNSAGEASAAENTSVNAVETSEEVVEQPESVAETDESVIEAPEETDEADEAEEAEEAEKTDTDAEEADRLTPEYNSKGQKVSAFAETVADVGMRLNEAGRTEEGADMVETANRIAENPTKNRTGVISHEKTAKLAEERMAKTDEGKSLQESIKEAVVRYDTALNGKDGIETLDTADTYAVLDYAKSAKELGMTDEYDALLAIAAENFTRAGRLVELAKVWAIMSGASYERYMKRHQKSFNKQLRKKLSKMKQAEFVHAQKFTHIRSNPMYLRAC